MSIVEWIASAFGLACVALCIARSVWNWPVGLVQVVLFVWVFYEARLYSDVLLHLVYIVLQLYGWYHWVRGKREDEVELPITRLSAGGLAGWAVVAVVGTAALGTLMARYTDADLPYWDASIAAMSLVAQYLLTRKVLETWSFWVAVDVVAVGVYGYKGLHAAAGLYAVFLGMAITGWAAWHKTFQASREAQRAPGFPATTPLPAASAAASAAAAAAASAVAEGSSSASSSPLTGDTSS